LHIEWVGNDKRRKTKGKESGFHIGDETNKMDDVGRVGFGESGY
jgi:hypothetical protein